MIPSLSPTYLPTLPDLPKVLTYLVRLVLKVERSCAWIRKTLQVLEKQRNTAPALVCGDESLVPMTHGLA